METEILYKFSARHIGEIHMPHFHAALTVIQLPFAVGSLVGLVQKLKHSSCAGDCILQLRHNAGYFVERFCILGSVSKQARQPSHGQAAPYCHNCTCKSYQRVDYIIYKPCGGIYKG